MHIAKDALDEEAIFMKDRSVFKDFKDDSNAHIQKCFEQDMEWGKLARFFKKEPETYEKIKEILLSNYVQLINIFNFYSGTSDYPRISMNDITSFGHTTNIIDHNIIKLADFDLLIVATNVSTNKYKVSAERDFCRYEFLEFLVRTAQDRYLSTKECANIWDSTQRLLDEVIFPNC